MDDRQLRASDAERDAVIDQLRTHTAEGRLSLGEFEERVSEALHATTRAELEDVLRELPALDPTPTGRDDAQQRDRKPRVALSRVAAVALGVVALVVVLQGHFFWWLIPIFFWTGGFGLFGGCANGDRKRGLCGSTRSSAHGRAGQSFGSSHGSHGPSLERQLTEV